MSEKKYNIRVYGILRNDKNEILITDEHRMGINMTKFPGGGLELGEGIIDCLKREWREELKVEIEIEKHFYTTDFFIKSAFNNAQLISIYYLVKLKTNTKKILTSTKEFDFAEIIDGAQTFRWLAIENISENDFTFPIDKKVATLLKKEFAK
jgi:mutator protein MutT